MTLDTDIIVAVTQLLNRYGHVVDDPENEDLSTVFTGECVFDQSLVGGERLEGIEAFREFLMRPPGEDRPTFSVSHHSTNTEVFEEDGSACARSKFLAIDHATGAPHVGDYEDRLALTDAGWRIAERRVSLRATARG